MKGLLSVLVLLVSFLFFTELTRFKLFSIEDVSSDTHEQVVMGNLSEWNNRGTRLKINNHYMYVQKVSYTGPSLPKGQSPPTLILIHGFPTSSFDYYRVIDNGLARLGDIILFDHVGFGLSDKPSNFGYSMMEHAEQALLLWRELGIKKAHLIAHDMGDTILTEILARRSNGILPDYFKDFFASITFTNGGMLVEHINFRASQLLLLHPLLGPIASRLSTQYPALDWVARRQLASIWSPSANQTERDIDIDMMQKFNRHAQGTRLMHKTIQYLADRFRFQSRYISAVQSLSASIPCHLIWGDSDAVSPPALMTALSLQVPRCKASFMTGRGHFTMLEDPHGWIQHIQAVVAK